MSENRASENDVVARKRTAESNDGQNLTVLKLAPSEPRETVCEVCGHVNKGGSLICEMCSNYLFD